MNNFELIDDHCILLIMEKLTIKELIHLAELSKQFKKLSKFTVQIRYPSIVLKKYFRRITKKQCKHFLDTFAENIQGLAVNRFNMHNTFKETEFIELIMIYYNKKQLQITSLSIENFVYFTPLHFRTIFPILLHINELYLSHSIIPLTISSLIILLPKLTNLTLLFCDKTEENEDSIIQSLMSIDSHLSFQLSKHNQSNIKEIKLIHNQYLQTFSMIEKIHEILPKLVHAEIHQSTLDDPSLSIPNYSTLLSNLTKIPSLKSLDIHLNYEKMSSIIESLISNSSSIETLNIGQAEFDISIINKFKKLPQIKNLKLLSILKLKKFHIKPIARNLMNLTSLKVDCIINWRLLTHIVRVTPHLLILVTRMKTKNKLTDTKTEQLNEIAKKQNKSGQLIIHIFNQSHAFFHTHWIGPEIIEEKYIHIKMMSS